MSKSTVLRIKGNRRVVLKNPIDPTTWNAEETLRNVSLLLDENGNVIIMPTMAVNVQNNPITASGALGSVQILDGAGNGFTARVINNATAQPYGGSVGAAAGSALLALAAPIFGNQTNNSFDTAETASAISTVVLPNAGSTSLASAVASKKYKVFNMAIAGGAAAGTCTINEATSGIILFGVNSVAAAGSESLSIQCGPNGILQPTVNNAIQVTTSGASVGYATIVYGGAR